jgi:diaminohydroxyphosphoribosylaminopyrimidine deaminase/5-amino-6-(5-phosphoribosylamino)uracil reductase
VSGAGIKKLKDAGIEVSTGVLASTGEMMNKRFFTFMRKQRPYIILKWAQTADGFIARENLDSKWISDSYSRQLVHQWRSEEDAILVGSNTARHDNPQLNVRDWTGRNPLRIVIDRNLTLPHGLHVFDGSQQTVCYNIIKNEHGQQTEFVKLSGNDFLKNLIDDLHRRKIQSLIVEGGAQILNGFIEAGLWDEVRLFVSDQKFGSGIPAPQINGNFTEEKLRSDLLRTYYRIQS